ncbi:hypothetical protein MMC07_005852 [Pseudocyphellaria aurata]|nr:hypothetical protein [Pseudocyphellaria aurata]
MTAVSSPLNGRALNAQGSTAGNKTTWDYVRPHSQERSKASFSKPFSPSNQPFSDSKLDSPAQIIPGSNNDRPPQDNTVPLGYDLSAFTAGPQIPLEAAPNVDPTYLSPYRHGGPRAAQSDLSRSGSEPDSLIELYGRPRSGVEGMDHGDQTNNRDLFYLDDEDPERSRWIHRDKLALIESQEMREAGIKLPPPGRSSSKSNGTRAHHREASREPSRDRYRNGVHSNDLGPEDANIQRSHPEAEKRPDGTQEPDVQTTEDVSAEPYPETIYAPPYRQQGLRVSSSRIPVPKSSALPLPQGSTEKQALFPRKRGTSGNWSGGDEDGIAYNKTRSRSHSVGSQALLDDGEAVNGNSDHSGHTANIESPSISPTKRQISKSGQSTSTSARKATNALRNASDPQKSRSPPTITSRSSPSQRPKSRSGLESRPATAINRPEGEAPWLATMYKPDPRLPPEQQLLPTHAKRLQQEREGVPGSRGSGLGSVLDEDVGHFAAPTADGLQMPSSSPEANIGRDEKKGSSHEPAWPLKGTPTKESGSPVSGVVDHGGYSTIPKMQSAPSPTAGPTQSPKVGQKSLQPHPQQAKVSEDKESGKEKEREGRKKEGSCACCVVM